MKQSAKALYSEYVIDGLRMDSTPAQLLDDCRETAPKASAADFEDLEPIVDESLDPNPRPSTFIESDVALYIKNILELAPKFPVRHPQSASRLAVATALIDALRRKGSFSLENLSISPVWHWSAGEMGNMAAFYASVESMCQYIYDLGVKIDDYGFVEQQGNCILEIGTSASAGVMDEFSEGEMEISLEDTLQTPDTAVDDPTSWILYIPFDTCPYRLGGSALSGIAGNCSDNAPEIQDPDYFIDCFEVVRELVEDGVAISAATVSKGGLATAAARLCARTGLKLDVSGIAASYGENNLARILFGEVPGIVIQIRDIDYDYIDSQFLLEDVAYYTLGHPSAGNGIITVKHNRKPAISGILEALISQASEGED